MKKIIRFKIALVLVPALLFVSVSIAQENKKILNRADSFFGLHFDFHATEADSGIGKTFTYGMADSMLSLVHPDFIQVDCKGHPGISSYPTKVGNPAPGFIKDPYRIWRDVTGKNGVALYVHYSGVIDSQAVKKHPGWAALDEEGKIIQGKNSVKGPYADSLLIPQLKELISNYHINGAWIDGESWALEPDYSNYMLDAFHKETGIMSVPKSAQDAGWQEFREFNRTSFKQYIAHYVNELHKFNPGFQLTSNWAFSSLMPDPVDIDVDFISGDYTPDNSVYSGLFEARCIAPQGKPWDLMAWSFTYDGETGVTITKSPVQLMQAAATVISMGGGFQLYFQQNRDASLRPWNFQLMKQVADFCRARQPFCKGAVPVPQIAVLYSSANFHKNSKYLYQYSSNISFPVRGMLNMLIDSRNAVEILMEHTLEKKINEYPLVIIPECEYLTEEFKSVLLRYVKSGGKLLLAGPAPVKMFSEQLNVKLTDSAYYSTKYIGLNGQMAGINSLYQQFEPGKSVETFGNLYNVPDFRYSSSPAATITSYGRGQIAAIYFNMGREYLRMTNPVYRDFVNGIVKKLFSAPIVTVNGTGDVAVTLNKLGNKLAVNLINMSGPHANTRVSRYDSIPAVGPLSVKIKYNRPPKKVMLQPENIPLKYSYSEGEIIAEVEQLDVHSIIVIE